MGGPHCPCGCNERAASQRRNIDSLIGSTKSAIEKRFGKPVYSTIPVHYCPGLKGVDEACLYESKEIGPIYYHQGKCVGGDVGHTFH